MEINQARIERLRSSMVDNHWDSVYIGAGGDLQYIVGLERGMINPTDSNMHGEEVYGAFINQDRVIFVLPELAIIASEFGNPLDGLNVITDKVLVTDEQTSLEVANRVFSMLGNPKNIAVNSRCWIKSEHLLCKAAPDIKVEDAGGVLSKMRSIKDAFEIELMRGAGKLTDVVFSEVIKHIKVGTTELEIIEEIQHQCLINGGSGMSFHPTASVRGGMINHLHYEGGAPRTMVQPGAVISFDFGVIYKGYASDFGRTLFMGDPLPEHIRYHNAVMETQKLAIDAMKSGKIRASELDHLAHHHMEELGLGHMFIHRLGHGVGIDVHEPPYAFPADETTLLAGMTMAIEPSCYVPCIIGVRVEDVVLVGDNGGETLSNFSRDLLVA